mgnify:CR=1 FL=1
MRCCAMMLCLLLCGCGGLVQPVSPNPPPGPPVVNTVRPSDAERINAILRDSREKEAGLAATLADQTRQNKLTIEQQRDAWNGGDAKIVEEASTALRVEMRRLLDAAKTAEEQAAAWSMISKGFQP